MTLVSLLNTIWIILAIVLFVFPFCMLLLGIIMDEFPSSIVSQWLNKLDLWLDRYIIHPSRYSK